MTLTEVILKAAPSMALSESGGTIPRRTAYCRHLEKMHVVRARRQYAKRSTTYRARTRHPWRGRKESVVILRSSRIMGSSALKKLCRNLRIMSS